MNTRTAAPRLSGLALLVSLFAAPALAQGVYRIVGPDGKVTFSDQPPPAATPVRSSGPVSSGAAAGAQLPFELRQVSSRYPVVLYTGRDCAPCSTGRSLLNARGIPYTEKTIETAQDGEALKRLSGEASLPFLTIGSQQIKGFSDTEWTQFLNAAGYPKQSALPPAYQRPAATPLVTVRPGPSATAAQPASPGVAPADTPAEVPVTPPPQNPAGIRF